MLLFGDRLPHRTRDKYCLSPQLFFFKIAHCSPGKVSLPRTHGARRAAAPSVLPPWSKSRLSRPQYPCLSSSLVPAEVTHSWVTVSVDSTSVFVWWLSALLFCPLRASCPFCQTVSWAPECHLNQYRQNDSAQDSSVGPSALPLSAQLLSLSVLPGHSIKLRWFHQPCSSPCLKMFPPGMCRVLRPHLRLQKTNIPHAEPR